MNPLYEQHLCEISSQYWFYAINIFTVVEGETCLISIRKVQFQLVYLRNVIPTAYQTNRSILKCFKNLIGQNSLKRQENMMAATVSAVVDHNMPEYGFAHIYMTTPLVCQVYKRANKFLISRHKNQLFINYAWLIINFIAHYLIREFIQGELL